MTGSLPIAIVGMSCRLPGGANSPEAYWQLLCNKIDAISEVPSDRWSLDRHFDADRSAPGRTYTRHGGFLKGVDIFEFDAEFFGLSPREAACMDPQQRLLLELTWEALEEGGQRPETLIGAPVGVFVGLFMRDFETLQYEVHNRSLIDVHTGIGTSMSIAANRISYLFDFVGPSLAVDTACSSSLVAVHLACQSLRSGECTQAIAGGVNILLRPEMTIATSKASMLSPDGRCKSFDTRANGYARAEGAGIVVLKPLAAALADGDDIHAVIRGGMVNQDGRTTSLTVPNGQAQERALRAALGQAGLTAHQIQYVEAHGTGTPIGDPVEVRAIGNVFGKDRNGTCVMGSVKSNIGHSEAAAGVAGLIKTVMALEHRLIPANIHLLKAIPEIAELQLRVPTELEAWPETEGPRLAAVNSFGFGGTNATVVLEEAPPRPSHTSVTGAAVSPVASGERAMLLPLSGRGPEAVRAVAQSYRDFLKSSDARLADICYSAGAHRGHHDDRLALAGNSVEELVEQLDAFLDGEPHLRVATGLKPESTPSLAFVCSGMGPQWWAMGRQLMADEPIFRATIEECDRRFVPLAGWSIMAELSADESASRINETHIAQPAIFSIQVALAALWRSWGVLPEAVVGHSVGEVAAGYISGALSFDDATLVIYHRSRLQHQTAGLGKMLAVGLSPTAVEPFLSGYADRVSVAAINSPDSITLSGDSEALEAIAEELNSQQVFSRFLRVEVPYHSPIMETIRAELLDSLRSIRPQEPEIPLYSTVTGQRLSGAGMDMDYWWQNVRKPVRFADAVSSLRLAGLDTFLEIGAQPVLATSMGECLGGKKERVLGSLRREQPERATLLASLGKLYTLGYPIEFTRLGQGTFVRLPAYPWQRERYWNESDDSMRDRIGLAAPGTGERADGRLPAMRSSTAPVHPLLGTPLDLPPSTRMWEANIDTRQLAYLNDHRAGQTTVYPGAAYVEMALAAAREVSREAPVGLARIEFQQALFLSDDSVRVQGVVAGDAFEVYSHSELPSSTPGWTRHVTGTLARQAGVGSPEVLDLEGLQRRCPEAVSKHECYGQFEAMGFQYGPAFQRIGGLWRGIDEAVASIESREPDQAGGDYILHPTLLDACLQVLLGTKDGSTRPAGKVYLPVELSRLDVFAPPAGQLWCHARLTDETDQRIRGSIQLLDATGRVLVSIGELVCLAVDQIKMSQAGRVLQGAAAADWYYEVQWVKSTIEASVPSNEPPATWVIFADSNGVGAEVAAQLTARFEQSIVVTAGDGFRHLGPGRYQIDPGRPEEMVQLFADIGDSSPIRGVVHLWSLDMPPAEVSLDQTAGCLSVLHLVQALASATLTPRLWLVTRGVQTIDSGPVTLPQAVQQAPLWGLAQVVAMEHPKLQCVRVDLDPAKAGDDASMLGLELEASDGETQLAYRHGARLVARLVPADLSTSPGQVVTLRDDRTYLVTGGLGSLGLKVAAWLIERGARHLALVGRKGAAGKEDALAILESAGATVRVFAADISDAAEATTLLAEVTDSMPPLRGVIHAAGVLDDGVLIHQSADRFRTVMAPKVHGSWNLHTATKDLDLDFFVYFSSVASLLGSPGQGNYAAGNAFMDALAHHRRGIGLPALSVNWGPWADEGMAAAVLGRLAETRGFNAIAPAAGLVALDRVMASATESAQIGIAPIEWSTFVEEFPSQANAFVTTFVKALDRAPTVVFLDQLRAAPAGEHRALVTAFLRGELARILGFKSPEHIKPRKRLFDLGLDSLMAVELKNRLEAGLELSLPTTLLFDYSTVEALAEHLLTQVAGVSANAEAPVVEAVGMERLIADLEDLSAEEIAALLSEELGASRTPRG